MLNNLNLLPKLTSSLPVEETWPFPSIAPHTALNRGRQHPMCNRIAAHIFFLLCMDMMEEANHSKGEGVQYKSVTGLSFLLTSPTRVNHQAPSMLSSSGVQPLSSQMSVFHSVWTLAKLCQDYMMYLLRCTTNTWRQH